MRGFVPAVVALAISWSATEAYASPDTARTAIDIKLASALFKDAEGLTTAKKAPTASSTDLLFAIGDLLENGTSETPEDLFAGAFKLLPGEKARKDKNTIAGALVTRIINTGNLAANDTKLTAIVTQAVSPTNGLSSSGKAAATAAALALATNASAGAAVGHAALDGAGATSQTTLQTFVGSIVKAVGANTVGIKGLIDDALVRTQVTDKAKFVTSVATSAIKNADAAGEVLATHIANLNATDLSTFTTATLKNSKLTAAATDVAAAASTKFVSFGGGNTFDLFVTNTINSITKAKASVRGSIAGGALQASVAAGGTPTQTAAILNAGVNGIAKEADLISFGTSAAVRSGSSTAANDLATFLLTKITTAANATKLAQGIIKGVAAATPAAAEGIAATFAGNALLSGAKTKLAQDLAKSAISTAAAAGAAVAGVVSTDTNNRNVITIAAIKSASKAAIGIAAAVATDVTVIADPVATRAARVLFAQQIALGSTSAASSIAVGVSTVDPGAAADIVAAVVNQTSTKNVLGASAAKVAGAVGLAVDVEQAAMIGQKLAGLIGTTANLKLSQASGIASALAKAITTKATTPDGVDVSKIVSNRVDELSELAGSMISGLVGKTANATTSASKKNAAESSAIASISNSILKALSKTLLSNAGNNKIDIKDAVREVAGSIAAAISANTTISADLKNFLLGTNLVKSSLQKSLEKTVGSKFAGSVSGAFTLVRDGFGGAFQIQAVVDPETPSKNG